MEGPYYLVSELHAHDGPVRSLSLGVNGEIISGSQANSPSVRRWFVQSGQVASGELPTLLEAGDCLYHSHWVTALTHLEANLVPAFPDGLIVTGCMDSIVRIFNPSGELLLQLEGHKKGIISFSWTGSHRLISGSWDGTARIWDLEAGGALVQVLGPHENGVHVLGLANELVVTTSTGESVNDKPANFQIRMWDAVSGRMLGNSIRDHDGPIRSIGSIVGLGGFVTCSNDGTLAARAADGSIIGRMMHPLQEDGMPPFVLDCANLHTPSGLDFVSGGEDGSVVVWESMELRQAIHHPCCVWCVLPLPDGDFLTGGNDGVIRYFSRHPDWAGHPLALQLTSQFLAEVEEAQSKKRRGPSADDLAKAPKWSQRATKRGTSDGQVMLFNKDETLIAAQWSADSGFWVEVGEVTGTGDSGVVNGVNYDHVMPVEMETAGGVMTLQLGYNNGENPFLAAQRFINENSLPQYHLKQIAEWIQSKAGKQTPTIGGSSSSSSSAAAAVAPPTNTFAYGTQVYQSFADAPSGFASKVMPKVEAFNETQQVGQLNAAELSELRVLLTVLEDSANYHSSKVTNLQFNIIKKILTSWELDKQFPAFDVLRLLALHASGSEVLAGLSGINLIDVLGRVRNLLAYQQQAPPASVLTASRFLANALGNHSLRKLLFTNGANFYQILDLLLVYTTSDSNPIKTALSTLLLNTAIGISEQPAGISAGTNGVVELCVGSLVRLATAMLKFPGLMTIAENSQRVVVSLGMAISARPSAGRTAAAEQNVVTVLRELQAIVPDSAETAHTHICINGILSML